MRTKNVKAQTSPAYSGPGGDRTVRALDSIGSFTLLDVVTHPLQRAVRALPLGPARDVLHGRPLGHPLHPALVQMPVGAWLSAGVLDAVPGGQRAARTLVGLGLLSAGPAVMAGWADWAEQHEPQLRTGFVHAASNGLAIGLYAASWIYRRRGRTGLGRLLGYAGMTAASTGAMIGGHLAYRQAAGVNKAEVVPHMLQPRHESLGSFDEIPPGEPVRRMLGEVSLVVVRAVGEDDEAAVLAERCGYDTGPLSEGRITDSCVACPWCGSVYRLADGWNVEGPASAPQPCFETRVEKDRSLQVRLPGAG